MESGFLTASSLSVSRNTPRERSGTRVFGLSCRANLMNLANAPRRSVLFSKENRMAKSLFGARLATGVFLASLGWAAPSFATYGGGACNTCAPVAVVQTSTVALAPQCQTVNQTVYETVYQNSPTTIMETRYRTEMRGRTLHRDAAGHRDFDRAAQVHRDEAGLPNQQRRTEVHRRQAGLCRLNASSANTR